MIVASVALVAFAVGAALPAPAGAGATGDRATKQNILVIQNYIERYGAAHRYTYPSAWKVGAGTGLGELWPDSVYGSGAMLSGKGAGDFTYRRAADQHGYTLTGHLLGYAEFVVSGRMPRAITRLRNEKTRVSVALIRQFVDLWADQNDGLYPSGINKGTFVDVWTAWPWPTDAWTSWGMSEGTQPGSFTYEQLKAGKGFSIAGHLSGGNAYTIEGNADDNLSNVMRIHLKNEIAMSRVQVLKDYVDEWQAAHAGTLPTVGQMTPGGAVGLAHSWWPANPWTLAPMAASSATGDYVYTPNGGSFTISVVLEADALYPSPYTAQ